MRRLFRILRNIVIGFIVLVLLLSGFLKYVHYPNILATIKLGLAPASKTPDLMPAHLVNPATKPIILPTGKEEMPSQVMWKGGLVPWQKFLDDSYTNAFLVIRNGVITYQYYKPGVTAQTRLPSYSVAKTMTSIVIGQLIDQGLIKESDKFVDFFPKWKTGTAFDQVTIQSLLDMESGIGVKDNYPSGISGWGVAIAQMYATTDMNWFVGNNRKMLEAPDTKPDYRSVNTQLLGLIIKKVTGERVSDYFSMHVWQPIGAQYPATWNVDHVGGMEKTFCCFNATAVDYAKVGLAIINGGYSGANKIISSAWLKRMETPAVTLDGKYKYGAQVWHPYPGISTADGLHGQYIFVNPATRTVIVKLSDVPTTLDLTDPTEAVMYKVSQLKQ